VEGAVVAAGGKMKKKVQSENIKRKEGKKVRIKLG